MTDERSAGGVDMSPAQFHDRPGVADWRVTATGPEAVFRATSLSHAAALIPAVLSAADRSGLLPDVDLRPEAVIVRIPMGPDGSIPGSAADLAASVSEAAAAERLTPDPSAVQYVGLYVAQHSGVDARPFFEAALGYRDLGDTDAVDPLRRGPGLAFNPIRGDAPGRGRLHLDVFVPADRARDRVEAALAAGGRLVDDTQAPAWWTLASPDNHGVDIAAWTDS